MLPPSLNGGGYEQAEFPKMTFLENSGLRPYRLYTQAACSPSRATLLTGMLPASTACRSR